MKRNGLIFPPVVYIALVLYFLLGFSTLAWGDQAAAWLFDEDRYFENIGALSLFIASLLCFYVFLQAWRTRAQSGISRLKLATYLGLAVLFFFGAGEEISWGQRIFHLPTPEPLAQTNLQEELNIHNLAIFEASDLLKADTIFTVFWMIFNVLLPLVAVSWLSLKRRLETWTPIPHLSLGALFLINYGLAQIAKPLFASLYTFPTVPFAQAVQEVKESNYELLFILVAVYLLREVRKPRSANRAS